MSCQKGNTKRCRSQKYKNGHAFKNTLHDTSTKTKKINNTQIVNVCEKCKNIIEWKIKYKKYKPLKAPSACVKCEKKCVKHAYHIMCDSCAIEHEVCAKCNERKETIKQVSEDTHSIKLDKEIRLILKTLPERKRRTFMRYINKTAQQHKTNSEEKDVKEEIEPITIVSSDELPFSRDHLLEKLKSLMISPKNENSDVDDSDSPSDDEFD